MHVYAFGSICRGEIDVYSDIDLLAIVAKNSPNLDPNKFSIYSYQRLQQLWSAGNPFSWHLSLEAKLLYACDGQDFLESLGEPNPYQDCKRDCEKFLSLAQTACSRLRDRAPSQTFELATVFLAIRNFATCYALGQLGKCIFSRNSFWQLDDPTAPLTKTEYDVLERARILSTRGVGEPITAAEAESVIEISYQIESWMQAKFVEIPSV
ncbi:nucleotidyltransferase domain-containing protein [Stieleria mannarensis]|uniref:nucleotidyltransferase domain-containing protein n=1 Tax=Stieleria mannarensis TaxID=2755585 RepID=UPI003369E39C